MSLQSSIIVSMRYCTVGAELFGIRLLLCTSLGEAEEKVKRDEDEWEARAEKTDRLRAGKYIPMTHEQKAVGSPFVLPIHQSNSSIIC